MSVKLIINLRNQQTAVEITKDVTSIGRSSANDIKLDDSEASREHCRIIRLGPGQYKIADLDSKNGTKINGKDAKEAILTPGDIISVGDTKLTFMFDVVPIAPQQPAPFQPQPQPQFQPQSQSYAPPQSYPYQQQTPPASYYPQSQPQPQPQVQPQPQFQPQPQIQQPQFQPQAQPQPPQPQPSVAPPASLREKRVKAKADLTSSIINALMTTAIGVIILGSIMTIAVIGKWLPMKPWLTVTNVWLAVIGSAILGILMQLCYLLIMLNLKKPPQKNK